VNRIRKYSSGALLLDLVLLALGIALLLFCTAYIVGTLYLSQVLSEVEKKDFSPANLRISKYEDFFGRLKRSGIAVEQSTPYIKGGVRYFLWTVSVPNSSTKLVYRWKHDLKTNKVEPLTSPATHLDVELGNLTPEEAYFYPFDPDDELAIALAKGTYEPPSFGSEPAVASEDQAGQTEKVVKQEDGGEASEPQQHDRLDVEGSGGQQGVDEDAQGEAVEPVSPPEKEIRLEVKAFR